MEKDFVNLSVKIPMVPHRKSRYTIEFMLFKKGCIFGVKNEINDLKLSDLIKLKESIEYAIDDHVVFKNMNTKERARLIRKSKNKKYKL